VPAVELTTDDLAPFAEIEEAKAEAMIEDALGQAKLVAPCIFDDEFTHDAAAKSVLRAAVLRWNDAGTDASQQLVALGFSQTMDTRQPRRGLFLPSEIELLQSMCLGREGGAYTIDTVPYTSVVHADVCSLVFGAAYCSCGADLTLAWPLWETEDAP
jgi:hypothetical protein